MINETRLQELLTKERATFAGSHLRSRAAYENATHLFGKVPMTWMNKSAAGHPVYLDTARGAKVTDIDNNTYLDLCLGDTGAMAGHSPEATVEAVQRRFGELGGATAMMPTEDAEWVGEELTRRFGIPLWSFSLSATDANRWAIRLVRALSGRPKILVNSYCYHGSVDESLIVVGPDGEGESREGNVGAPVDVTQTSRVAEFNDLDALERQLAHGDVAAVLMEPALTNIGIILPEDGYLDGVRELTREHGTLLIIDETHTFSAGPGGMTASEGLQPDVLTIGKAMGGGIPCGAYGLSGELVERIESLKDLDLIDTGGVGGTLAGNPVSVAAMRATLGEVLTDDAFVGMTDLATRFVDGVESAFDKYELPWSIRQLGARAEYRFTSPAPRNGTESAAAHNPDLDDYMHIYLANRGILLTPFHAMALMCPATTAEDVDLHTEVFHQAAADLVGT
ncbi:MAG: aminotransferase class III-fold pyridoxal phosphate-dependent enzyme [Thermoleophilia bacterium]|nr:aminotransferase class III-fold pyridoxal phosphate-dependent enzyme [Thermoleophilia bacterium]